MTDKDAAQAESTHEHDFVDAVAEMQRAGLGSLNWMGVAWLEAMGDLGAEVASFIAERIREDVKAQHDILHCKTAAELQHVQGQFVQRAIDEYTAETGRIVELERQLWENALTGTAASKPGDAA